MPESLKRNLPMKKAFIPFLLLLFAFTAFCSCSKIELEGVDDKKKEDKTDGGTIVPSDDEVISVVDLADIASGSSVVLKCYIVGSTANNSLKNTQFGVSDKTVASNIVVADSPDETNYEQCAACQLENGSAVREDLNLVDNPQNLGELVYLSGTVGKYFNKMGLKPVDSFQWGYEWDEDGDDDDDPPSPTDSTSVVSIGISGDAEEVFEGC